MATDPASEPTFIAALRDDGIHALGVTDGSMDMGSFELCVEAILAPALEEGDIVIFDNLAAHGSAKAAKILESIGPGGTFSMMELLRAIRVGTLQGKPNPRRSLSEGKPGLREVGAETEKWRSPEVMDRSRTHPAR